MYHSKSFINIFYSVGLVFLVAVSASAQKSLSLDEAISIALEHNRSLKVSSLEISRVQQQSRIARSKALPIVNLNGQYAHYFDRPVFFGLGGTPGSDELGYARVGGENQLAATISIAQPLYNPAVRPELQQARLSESRSQFAQRDQRVEIVAQVKQNYLRVLVLHERLKLQQESLTRNKKVLEDARSLYRQGRALRVDTLRAYTTVKNLQPDLSKISNAITVARLQLITLLGVDTNEEVLLTDSLFIQTIGAIPTVEDIYAEAKNSRPDLQVLLLNEKIVEKEVSLAKAGKLPSVSLVGQYQVQTQLNNLRIENSSWPSVSFAGIQLTVPLFNGNTHSAKIKGARLAEQQTNIQVTEAFEQLKIDAQQVAASLQETKDRLETQGTVKETARLSYNIIQYRYEKGVASRLELTDAELALTTAEANFLEAVYDYLSANIQLESVTGRSKS